MADKKCTNIRVKSLRLLPNGEIYKKEKTDHPKCAGKCILCTHFVKESERFATLNNKKGRGEGHSKKDVEMFGNVGVNNHEIDTLSSS